MTGPNRKAVQASLRRLRDDADAASHLDGNVTVGAFLLDWLAREVPKFAGSPNTVANYRWAVERHLVPALGAIRLARLDADDVDRMLEGKAADGMARKHDDAPPRRAGEGPSSRRTAREGRSQRRSPHRGPGRPESRTPLAHPDQAKSLLATAGDPLECLVVVGLTLGLRPGELAGLSWDDVDLEARVLHVRRALKREPEAPRLGELKTGRSRRSLNMPAFVADALRRHRAGQAAERLAAGPMWSTSWGDLVFTTANGTPLDPSNLRSAFQRLCDRAGIGRWTPYELRHSAASLLSAAGVPLELIADMLGHDGTRMTSLVYRHAVAPTIDAAAAPTQAMFGT